MNETKTLPLMLTVGETAKKSGMSEYSIRKLIKSGRIIYIRPTTKILVNYDSFMDYLNKGDS